MSGHTSYNSQVHFLKTQIFLSNTGSSKTVLKYHCNKNEKHSRDVYSQLRSQFFFSAVDFSKFCYLTVSEKDSYYIATNKSINYLLHCKYLPYMWTA